MKKCPQCGRDYNDDSLSFCLDDGSELLFGPGSAGEPATAILHETAAPSEAATRAQILPTKVQPPSGSRSVMVSRNSFTNSVARPLIGLGMALLILVGGFFGYWYFNSAAKLIESIAVMPFVNDSGNADIEYLSDGMTETLIGSLSQLPNLSVKARSSVFRYKGKDTSSRAIGEELNVQAVLNGRIVQRGPDLILYVELVDAATENSLWKRTYTKTMSDLITLQNDVARDVAETLRVKLSASDEQKLARNYTENTEAYQAYLRGRHIWNKGPVPGYEKGRDYFVQAIEIDPTYALAYAGLADFYGFSAANGLLHPDEAWPKCESAVNQALKLDDTLAEAYNPLAAVKMYFYRDWSAAEQAFRRGIELDPDFSEIRHHYALRLVHLGRGEEGLAEMQRAIDLDPLSVRFNLSLARLRFFMREYEGALDQMLKTLELDPNNSSAHQWLGNIYEQKSMHTEAVAAWVKAMTLRGESESASQFELLYRRAGFESAVRSLASKQIEDLDEKRRRGDLIRSFDYMAAYTRLGDVDQALAWFARVEEERSGFRFEVKGNPIFDPLRGDARYHALVKKIEASQ